MLKLQRAVYILRKSFSRVTMIIYYLLRVLEYESEI